LFGSLEFPVVFLSGYLDVTLTVRAMRVGAIDALQKPVGRDVLLDAVKRAFQRDEGRRARLAEEQSVRARFDSLTPRERDVLAQVVRGEATRSIATGLGSSEKTNPSGNPCEVTGLDVPGTTTRPRPITFTLVTC